MFMSLEEILVNIQKTLKEREEALDEIHQITRKLIRISKQTIFLIHQGKYEEARRKLSEADGYVSEVKQIHKGLDSLHGLVTTALQEVAEAHILLNLLEHETFIEPFEIDIPPIPYVLGLADVVGELRRAILDLIKENRIDEAEKKLEIMELIYHDLTTVEDLLLLVPGLRRKCDIARRIVEATRGDLTIEKRRSSLERSIRELVEIVEEEKERKRLEG